MSNDDMKKVLRLHNDLTKQHTHREGLDERTKLDMFKSAVNTVIATNRLANRPPKGKK